ncbi:MAG: hypothetical protein V2A78_04745 [bacterium]
MVNTVIDIGTNSVKLLIAEKSPRSPLRTISHRVLITRLGEGHVPGERLSQKAIKKTLLAVMEFLDQARKLGSTRTAIISTAAAREAENREEFARLVEHETGFPLRILSEEEESVLGLKGVLLAFPDFQGLVLDIGGGSFELTFAGKEKSSSHCFPTGCVRLTEKYIHNDPPSKAERDRINKEILRFLGNLPEAGLHEEKKLIGIGGTITTLAAMLQELELFDEDKVHRYQFSREALEDLDDRLWRLSVRERLAMSGLNPGRADIIPAGSAILRAVMKHFCIPDCTVSVWNLMHALIREIPI